MSARFHPYLCGRNAAEWLIYMKEKILIIEDDPLIRNELKTLLQSNGYKTVAPEDFSDVIDQIKACLLYTSYEYRHEGVNDYITAPVNIPALIRRVLFFVE